MTRKLLAVTSDPRVIRQLAELTRTSAAFQVTPGRADQLEPLLKADAAIAVVIVDHAPDVSAADAVRLLAAAGACRPDVRRGLLTGYGDVGAVVRGLHDESVQFLLQRPIVPGELLAMFAPRGVIAASFATQPGGTTAAA